MVSLTKNTGDQGEKLALGYLKKKGFKLLEKNWRKARGELDLIMRHEEYIVFIEVKTRSLGKVAVNPKVQMTKTKITQVRKIAQLYLIEKGIDQLQPRFDFVGVSLSAGQKPEIEHIENAF